MWLGITQRGLPCPAVPKQTGLKSNCLAGKYIGGLQSLTIPCLWFCLSAWSGSPDNAAFWYEDVCTGIWVDSSLSDWIDCNNLWIITIRPSQHIFLKVFWIISPVCFPHTLASNFYMCWNWYTFRVEYVLNFSTWWRTFLGIHLCSVTTFLDILHPSCCHWPLTRVVFDLWSMTY